MSMEYNHACIKCATKYNSDDPDAYLCDKCLDVKKKIAAEVDKKMANRKPKKTMSDLQKYDALTKKHGSQFVNIRDMGISL